MTALRMSRHGGLAIIAAAMLLLIEVESHVTEDVLVTIDVV